MRKGNTILIAGLVAFIICLLSVLMNIYYITRKSQGKFRQSEMQQKKPVVKETLNESQEITVCKTE
jgi:hypothetical protein